MITRRLLSFKNLKLLMSIRKAFSKNQHGDTSPIDIVIKDIGKQIAFIVRLKIAIVSIVSSFFLWFFHPMFSYSMLIYALVIMIDYQISKQVLVFIIFTFLLFLMISNILYAFCITIPVWCLYNIYLLTKVEDQAEPLVDEDKHSTDRKL
jgi:hypothetical protein